MRDGVAALTLNRPEKGNALTARLLESLAGALEDLERDGGARCVVLRGAGEKAFSVGMDLTAMAVSDPEQNQRLLGAGGPLRRAIDAIEEYPFPVVAMVHGYGIGAGCELAVACDLRVGREASRMGMPPAKLGMVYPPEGIERFARRLGISATARVFLTARNFDGAELHAMGILDFLCGEEIEEFTMELARGMTENAPLSMAGHKRTLRAISRSGAHCLDADRRAAVNDLVAHAMRSEDAKEGLLAFLEKRPPRFTGS